jgi:D-tyrosyl-tRNA(Tyr) deacylase
VGAIERGILAYVGFGRGDTAADRRWMVSKIVGMRIFEEPTPASASSAKMSLSLADFGGAVLLVSQFTLYGNVQPSFDQAMAPDEARVAYEAAIAEMRASGVRVETGIFRAHMTVHAVGDGPVTIWVDSADRGVHTVDGERG